MIKYGAMVSLYHHSFWCNMVQAFPVADNMEEEKSTQEALLFCKFLAKI